MIDLNDIIATIKKMNKLKTFSIDASVIHVCLISAEITILVWNL